MGIYCAVIIWTCCFVALFTYGVLRQYGVNLGNHSLFARIVRMKCMRRSASEIGEAIFWHAVCKLNGRGEGMVDIAPADLLDDRTFEEAMGVVVSKLLDLGMKPVCVDRKSHARILVGATCIKGDEQ